VLDLKARTEAVLRSFLLESLRWLAVAAAAIAFVLGVALRRPDRVVRVLGPVVLAELLTVGILAALDVRLSLFHILSLILVAGLGMDYGLFFTRQNAGDIVTLRAVMLCNATTGAVFLVMAFSSIPVLHGIGLTAALGAFLALVCTAAFTAAKR
jgi:predicted exporter